MFRSTGIKNPLVSGYLEKIPPKILYNYYKEIISLAGRSGGIYALHLGNKLFHVGLSKNLPQQAKLHIKQEKAGKWNKFSLYLVRADKQLTDMCALIWRIGMPGGGGFLSGFDQATDMTNILKEKIRAKQAKPAAKKKPVAKTRTRARVPLQSMAHAQAKKKGTGKVPLKGLISNKIVRLTHRDKTHIAAVLSSGKIKLKDTGQVYDTPSGAATAIVGYTTNGWHLWHYRNKQGQWVTIDNLRS
jgi:hypothetical protein